MEVEMPAVPAVPPRKGEIRRGLYLGSMLSVVVLTLLYVQVRNFWIPDLVAAIPYLSLPILSLAMLFYPGHRLLGLLGFITSGAVLYTLFNHMEFAIGC